MNVAAILEQAARTYPDNTAISWIDQPVQTYRELMLRAASLAGGLAAMGLRPGDRVTLAMSNSPRYYEILLGCWFAGLVAAPQNCRLHPTEIVYAAEDCQARVCFSTADLSPSLAERLSSDCTPIEVDSDRYERLHQHGALAIEPRAPADPALLFYTSGTTGKPKGAVHTHRTLSAMLVSFLADSGVVVDDHILHLAPMSHASGFLGLSYLARGRNQVILPTGGLDHDVLGRALTAFGPVSLFAAPTIVRRLMQPDLLDPALISRIKRIFFGGAPMYVGDMKQAIAVFGPERLWHLYGQGETPNTITHLPPRLLGAPDDPHYARRLASVGVPRSGVLVRVRLENGTDAGPGELGEVVVQGDTLMGGYWGRPEASAATLRGGWLHTGDLGFLDEHGFLTLVDRSKDLIISGGSNIYPREIEEVLLTHPNVVECAVIGLADDEWGEVPFAFIVAEGEEPSPDHLGALCLDNLARYKRPRGYRFVAELPKSAYGKVLKTDLRALAQSNPTT